MLDRIGFIQGRLSPKINGLIQAFPWDHWESEFGAAMSLGLPMMEWTLDHDRLHHNPLMTEAGRRRIAALEQQFGVAVASLTGDCFMQAPFWKATAEEADDLARDFEAVCEAASASGIRYIVVPLVDNGRLQDMAQEDRLVAYLQVRAQRYADLGVAILFESDFAPAELARFISRLDRDTFGINYDSGNSAALGWSPAEEVAAYGDRIRNVHIKDRIFGGTTVPLGTGNVDFDAVFAALASAGYAGNFILQTARATDNRHDEVLASYRDMTLGWIARYLPASHSYSQEIRE